MYETSIEGVSLQENGNGERFESPGYQQAPPQAPQNHDRNMYASPEAATGYAGASKEAVSFNETEEGQKRWMGMNPEKGAENESMSEAAAYQGNIYMGSQPMAGTMPQGQPMAGTMPQGQPMAGTMPQGQPMAGMMPQGQPMPGTMPQGQPMAGTMPQGQPMAGMMPQGQPMPGMMPQGQPMAGMMPQGQPMAGMMPQGQPMPGMMPQGQPMAGMMPQGQPMPGMMPQGQPMAGMMPQGQPMAGMMPQGQPMAGMMPQGQPMPGMMPQGQAMAGMMPQGQPMPGMMPQGYAMPGMMNPGQYMNYPVYGMPEANFMTQQMAAMMPQSEKGGAVSEHNCGGGSHNNEDAGIFGMIKNMFDNNPQLSSLSQFANMTNSDFIKGLLIGAGVALVFSNDTVQDSMLSLFSGFFGSQDKQEEENMMTKEDINPVVERSEE